MNFWGLKELLAMFKSSETNYNKFFKISPYLILILAFILLFIRLSFLSFWGDEVGTILLTSSLERTFSDNRHPFLYYILVYFWRKFFGTNEFTLRVLSSLFSLCAVWFTYRTIASISDRKTGILTSFLLTISPFFILFSRMARYYSLVLLLSLISFYSCFAYLNQWFDVAHHKSYPAIGKNNKTKLRWVYIISSSMLFYTNYLSAIITIVAQNLYIISNNRNILPSSTSPAHQVDKPPKSSILKEWFLSQSVILALCVPIFLMFFYQITLSSSSIPAELSQSCKGQFIKLFYILYSFSFGETILPLELWFTVPGVLLYILCFWKGLKSLGWIFLTSFIIVPIIITLISTATVSASIPLAHIARLLLPIIPFYYAIVSAGILKFHKKWARWACIFLLTFISSYSLKNYFSRTHFLNPHYIVPWCEIADFVRTEFRQGDIVVNSDISFDYYAPNLAKIDLLSTGNIYKMKQFCINDSSYSRIWLFQRDRGQRNMVSFEEAIKSIIESYGFKQIYRKDYVKLSPMDISLKERMFGRKFCTYNFTIYLYARRE